MTVDLDQQTIVCGNRTYRFSIDPVRRARLLNGWDDIALTESYRDRIAVQSQRPRGAALGGPVRGLMNDRATVLIAGAGLVGSRRPFQSLP